MPFVALDDSYTGSGSVGIGATRVLYLAWEVTAQGPRVRQPLDSDSETLNGVGFIQFGNDLTAAGVISAVGWDEQHWLNTVHGQLVASGGDVSTGYDRWIADHLRWSFSLDTEVHMYLLVDS